tara:strand:- start:555 stop:986 length:432 start_codon:yes stop_codon:yes gene_type:complete
MRSEQPSAQTKTAVACIVDPNRQHHRPTETPEPCNEPFITATRLIKEHIKSNCPYLQLSEPIQHIAPHLTRQGPELQILQAWLIEEIGFGGLTAGDLVVLEQNDVAGGGACPLGLLHPISRPTIELLQRRVQQHKQKRRKQSS